MANIICGYCTARIMDTEPARHTFDEVEKSYHSDCLTEVRRYRGDFTSEEWIEYDTNLLRQRLTA